LSLRGNTLILEKAKQTNDNHISMIRQAHEAPAVTRQGWRYHHIGIPTDTPRLAEQYVPHLKLYVSGFETSPYGIEWTRFEEDCPVSELVRNVLHVALEVDDLDREIQGKELLGEVSSPYEGVRVAMIVDDGALARC
jgi:hypothetical protein